MVCTVLVVGGTGNVGRLLLSQLLDRGHHVRAIVRSEGKLPEPVTSHPNFTRIRASLLDITQPDLEKHVTGCDAVISTLGHVMSARGIWGPPFLLVTEATKRLVAAMEACAPANPAKFILLNTVGVSNPDGVDRKRGLFEAGFLWCIGTLTPPLMDSYRSARFLSKDFGTNSKYVEWCTVRPDAFKDGESCGYSLHPQLQSSLFNPGTTRKANIAHFMCELVDSVMTWEAWKGKLPVILDCE